MNIPFPRFEPAIDPVIANRGVQLFVQDAITELSEDNGQYTGRVQGTYHYVVKVTIEENEVTASHCTCPYNDGPICKHVVAILCKIRDDNVKKKFST